MVNLICSNCNLELMTYPTYILRYINKGSKSCMEKVFSCGDDNAIFPNDCPCVLLLKDPSIFNEIDCPNKTRKKQNKIAF